MVSQRHVIIKQYSNQTLVTQAQNFYLKVSLISSPPLSDSTGRQQELQIHFFMVVLPKTFILESSTNRFLHNRNLEWKLLDLALRANCYLSIITVCMVYSVPHILIISGFKKWFSDGGTLVISSRMCYLEFIHFMQLSIENKH